jgi:hypothetical protein
MKAPISAEIASVLQDSQSAYQLVSAVLQERSSRGKQVIEIRSSNGQVVKRYKPVSSIHRKKF